jgi:hypothetical protein
MFQASDILRGMKFNRLEGEKTLPFRSKQMRIYNWKLMTGKKHKHCNKTTSYTYRWQGPCGGGNQEPNDTLTRRNGKYISEPRSAHLERTATGPVSTGAVPEKACPLLECAGGASQQA